MANHDPDEKRYVGSEKAEIRIRERVQVLECWQILIFFNKTTLAMFNNDTLIFRLMNSREIVRRSIIRYQGSKF